MRYLCLVYVDESMWHALSGRERDAFLEACLPYDEELRASGHLIVMGSLPLTQSATTVRVRGGRFINLAGPHSEAPERVGGFYLIEARDLNQAIRVAANTAAGRLGERLGVVVEVRPVEDRSAECEKKFAGSVDFHAPGSTDE